MIDQENPLDMEPDDVDTGDMGPDDMKPDDMDTGDMEPDDMGDCPYTDQQLNDEIEADLGIEAPGDDDKPFTTRLAIDGTVISDIEKLITQLNGEMEGANGKYSRLCLPFGY